MGIPIPKAQPNAQAKEYAIVSAIRSEAEAHKASEGRYLSTKGATEGSSQSPTPHTFSEPEAGYSGTQGIIKGSASVKEFRSLSHGMGFFLVRLQGL